MIEHQYPPSQQPHEYPYSPGGGGAGSIDLYDEGVLQGPITELNLRSVNAVATIAGDRGTLAFDPANMPIDVVSVDTTLNDTHYSVVFNTLLGATLQCNLPDSALHPYRRYRIKNNGPGHVSINAAGIDSIDGNTSLLLSNQYESVLIQSTGSGWVVW